MSTWEVASRLIGAILALGLVLVLAWVCLRFMNRRMPGLSSGTTRQIRILDRATVGKSGQVVLLRVKEKVMLVAVTEHAVEKLYEYDDPEGETVPTPAQNVSFSSALRDAAQKLTARKKDGGEGP